jgi:hypothetical protein
MQTEKSEENPINQFLVKPRARAILEFINGDLSRSPIVYPVTGGSDEQDEELRREILKRWSCD